MTECAYCARSGDIIAQQLTSIQTLRAKLAELQRLLNSARVMLDLPLEGGICEAIGKLLDQYDQAVIDRDAAQLKVARLESSLIATRQQVRLLTVEKK